MSSLTDLKTSFQKTEKASLKPLMDIVVQDLEDTNQIILDRMHSDVELIPTLARHLIAAGGKRLRPVLTLALPNCAGTKGTEQKNSQLA
nr:hypothetical protein [Sneathiella glossodoripedis]